MLKFVQSRWDLRLDLAGSSRLASRQKLHTCQACGEAEASCQLEHQDKKSRLAIQLVRDLNSRLSQVARSSCQLALFWKDQLFAFQTHTSINTPHTHEILRAFRENIEREKPQRKTRLTYPQFSHRNSLNSSTFTLSIVISLRGSLPNPFLTIPTSMRRPFGAWEEVRKGPILYWLMLWFIAESGKLKKK